MSHLPAEPPPGAPYVLCGHVPSAASRAAELCAGLTLPCATIPPKFFYDDLGSRLFAAITELPEYYPPRSERSILTKHLDELVATTAIEAPTWIDLGAGDCQKSARMFAALRPSTYVAVDIAAAFLGESLACLQRLHPDVRMLGVATDFSTRLEMPHGVPESSRIFFYPGSSIGNFQPAAATTFLSHLAEQAGADGALWIGVDLHKDPGILEPAYNDSLGVTAAFNRNVLNHVNRCIGANFQVADWRHVARYDLQHRRIEMYLEAVRQVTAVWHGGERRFASGERILTEYSYKHDCDGFSKLLTEGGWLTIACRKDEDERFAVFVAKPRKSQ